MENRQGDGETRSQRGRLSDKEMRGQGDKNALRKDWVG
jgi:hypothetical protein